ncbi:MAG TPA: imidazoleglycerol-phosphate dehydratase [Methanothrix sp.]|nr:imidazoleglycerol-phosphate dehydratase [Methanothrix sp.]HPC89570.1 imidazoleglycerol-phosphate dehydratase [Methanothrix sp.]HQE88317.1 imidazoleglycerol-phosphate dehydratase [Methanothrix sp.]HQI67367.1 imidazoleglycerol-phosphate dehydratase [Methanothrix sp.]HRT16387.1 imidazoleglycerol-phosphate dehydratase [Methanothrix sp.]
MRQYIKRETKETSIEVLLEIDGQGRVDAETGVALLDEIIASIGLAGGFDMTVRARGDLQTGDHHTTEDTAITLGAAIAGQIKSGMASCVVPSGTAVATAAVRFGEPGYHGSFQLGGDAMGGMALESLPHFLRALAYNGGFNLFISAQGGDDRSRIEAMSTALGRAIKLAARDM